MRKTNILIKALLLLLPITKCEGQTKIKQLEVYSVTEYIDGYVIKAIDAKSSDTLNFISAKKSIANKEQYLKVIVGNQYFFEYSDYVSSSLAVASSFVIRIKSTIVWRSTDRLKDRPFFAQNIKGLWIKK